MPRAAKSMSTNTSETSELELDAEGSDGADYRARIRQMEPIRPCN